MILNSSSALCRLDVEESLRASGKNKTLVQVLFACLQLVHRPSTNTVAALTKKLENLSIRSYPGENVELFVQAANGIIHEIQMDTTIENQVPTLVTMALKGLTLSSHSYFKNKVLDASIATHVRGTSAPTNTCVLAKAELNRFKELYLELVSQGNYPPGKQQTTPDPRYQAMVTQVAAMEARISELSQNREASSTRGNNSGSRSGGTSGGTTGGSGASRILTTAERAAKVGLSEADLIALDAACVAKLESMPDRSSIPDSAEYVVKVGNCEAKFCLKCGNNGRFVKGRNAHFTSGHTGCTWNPRYRNEAAPAPAPAPAAAPAPAPAPASALRPGLNMMQVSPPGSRSVSFQDAIMPSESVFHRIVPETTYQR